MWLESSIGSLLGIIAGLTPGIHSNTFAALLTVLASREAALMIIAAAIAYTVVNIIPTTFLGVPDEDTAISVLPAHKMVLEGRGFDCITISAVASFIAIVVSIPLFFTVSFVFKYYQVVRAVTPIILILIAFLLIITERGEVGSEESSSWKKRSYALLIFTLSGLVGCFVFNYGVDDPLASLMLPMLTGFFATPVLISSAGKVRKQRKSFKLPDIEATFRGTLSGLFVSIFPGMSSGIATIIATINERNVERYIAAVSAANSANAILSLFSFLAAGKTRSGAAVALKQLGYKSNFIEISLVSFFAALLAFLATILIAFFFASTITKIDARKLSIGVLIFLIILIFYLTSLVGILVFFVSSIVGILCVKLRVKRVNCMGCTMLPVTIFYLDLLYF
ncbi:MAG: tripartite tricarboxylate transporter permease [Archaeoglobaceae archaeon]|nr:tripartite tricarboxylate transporter permease [Archaeoglobaceae archaeon]MCX8151921.1 tripartite tricarboxylate transporter permease [Archaeoglobaceae archaeon]MDW8013310.1 tripartite tricarboxylate transporter permease [Archaeoglobaceae archaeon]